MNKIISDEFLYTHMPQAEEIILDTLPLEDELNHIFSNDFNKKMKALIRYERKSPLMRQILPHIKAIAAVLLIIITVTFGTLITVDAYRIRFFEFVTQVSKEFTSILVQSNDTTGHDALNPVSPLYIPAGYTLLEKN